LNMDFERARQVMVETQLRPFDVTEARLVEAMRSIPREVFLPPQLRDFAYSDQELSIGYGRTLLRPRFLGRMLQALAVREGEKALEIAGGMGYGAAVLRRLGADVTMLEPIAELSFAARAALDGCGGGAVKIASTDLRQAWREGAPFDVILAPVGAEFVPEAWLEQLAEGGRLCVIVREGVAGQGLLFSKAGGAVASVRRFDAAIPVAAGLERPKSFTF
ncbi:MAG: protein-L-isoaspartate O-methyltransferase, partial [Hyphomonadaceae bacterium]|nr:protein-L-isoaspartate O-methyltransferase [Hyphomonadaceae bacterium]